MALLGNGTDQEIRVADNAALTLPDADWSRQYFIKFGTITSTDYFTEHGSGATNVYEIYINSGNNQLICHIVDGSGNEVALSSSSEPGADKTNFQHVLIEREGDTFRMCIDAVEEDSEEFVGFGSVNPAAFMGFLYRTSANGNFLQAHFAEAAQFNEAVFSSYGVALANGLNPADLNPAWHIAGDGFPTQALAGGLTIDTVHSLPTVTAHPSQVRFYGAPFLSSASTQYYQRTGIAEKDPIIGMSAWVKLPNPSSPSEQAVLQLARASSNDSEELFINSGQAKFISRKTGSTQAATSTAVLPTNTWFHIFGLWVSTASRKIWVNATNAASNGSTLTHDGDLNKVLIGKRENDGTPKIHGAIQECVLFKFDSEPSDAHTVMYNNGKGINPYATKFAGNVFDYFRFPRGNFIVSTSPNGPLSAVNSAGSIITRGLPNVAGRGGMVGQGIY